MKFYTDTVSKELLDELVKKGYLYKTIPMKYNTFLSGGDGYVEYGIEVPTYAEVLDWLLNKEFEINVFKNANNDFTSIADDMRDGRESLVGFGKDIEGTSFKETIEKAILLCLDFIELSDNSGTSYSISTEN